MPNRALVLLLGFALAGEAAAQAPPAPDPAAIARFRSHVSFLSNDLLEGRETGTRGYDIAAAYVASQFERLGLRPGGERGSWYQPVAIRSSTLGAPEPSVTISGPGGIRTWDNGTNVLVGPSLLEREQDLAAPVVFAGYGLDSPRQGFDDYRGLDVRGKVVAVLQGAPLGTPSELAAHLNGEKAVMASARGAIGLVTLPTDRSDSAVPWETRVRLADRDSMVWLGKDGRPPVEARGLRFGVRLNGPAAETLFAGSRVPFAAIRAEAEREGARPRGFALRTSLRLQRSSLWRELRSANVVGLLPGADPRLRDEYVVVTGHLDHLGVKSRSRQGEDLVHNGAIDNATGIATMLEAARAFTGSGRWPRRSILFVAVTAEEKGLLGSERFAREPTVPAEGLAAVVNLDMPLLLYDFIDVIAFGAEHSTLGDAVGRAASTMGIRLSPDPMPEQGIFVRSDHYSFVKEGVPSIMLATGFGNGGEGKWKEFLNGNYHSVEDEIGQPIDWDAAARFARLNYLIARELADAPARPRWYRGDFFGETFAPKAPKAAPPRRQQP
jgi:hypothetical protein